MATCTAQRAPQDGVTADYFALVERIATDVYNRADLAAVTALFAPWIRLNNELISREDFRASITLVQSLAPGALVEATEVATREDLVLVHWKRQRATSSGHSVGWTRPYLFRFVAKQVAEIWVHGAALDHLAALGLTDMQAKLEHS